MSHARSLGPIDRSYNLDFPLSPNCCSSFFSCLYHLGLHFIWHTRVTKFLFPVAFLTANIFLNIMSWFTCSHLFFRSSSFHNRSFGHFENNWGIRSPLAHIRGICPSSSPPPTSIPFFSRIPA